MDISTLNNCYSKAVFEAAYAYLMAFISDKPAIRKIYIHCTIDHDEGKHIVYNIHPEACINLSFTEKGLSFNARFNGVSTLIFLNWDDVNAIYLPDIKTNISPRFHDPFGLVLLSVITGIEDSDPLEKTKVKSDSDHVAQEKRSKFTVH